MLPNDSKHLIVKLNLLITLLLVTVVTLVACQATPVPPLAVEQGVEFALAPGEMATITDAGLTIKFISVLNDGRCPSDIECTESGPVQISLSIQKDNGTAEDLVMQTFTDNDGRSPAVEFEGIEDRIVYEGYLIRIVGVLPYPVKLSTSIRQNDYRVSFVVTEK